MKWTMRATPMEARPAPRRGGLRIEDTGGIIPKKVDLLDRGVSQMMGWAGGWWIIGVIVMLVCMYFLARMMMGHGSSSHGDHSDTGSNRSARDILAERFARGEISEEEYQERMRVLEHRPSEMGSPMERNEPLRGSWVVGRGADGEDRCVSGGDRDRCRD